jgi:pyruvate-ferredoxin/flavodoxin oxidoreductase
LSASLTLPMIAGKGDSLPVSLFPVDGTWPTGTAKYEKRNLALQIPVVETDLCTQCGKCVFVCPHSAIRAKVFPTELVDNAPATFKHMAARNKDYPAGSRMSYQVAPEDCTGCTLCVEVCPIRDKTNVSRKALNMAEQAPLRKPEAENWEFFLKLPDYDRRLAKRGTLPGSMLLQPLFRVLRRLRWLRRNALHSPGDAVVRRPHDGCQRHRLFVDLWRQSANHALHHGQRWARAGLEQFAV